MSLSFDENFPLNNNFQDNQASNALKKAKMEDGQARATQQVQKRAALGTITNNPGVRIQPFRAAKQQAGLGSALYVFGGAKNDENAFSRAQQKTAFAVPTTTQSFAIHVDPQPSLAQSKPDATVQELNPALTTLSRPALTDVFVANRPAEVDSPMLIDSSDDEDFEYTTETAPEIRDIDTGDDILFVSDYASEIFQYLKQAEVKNRPKPGYMKKQSDINHSMRSILVDWLVEVAEEYKLLPQTLYLTVNYIDRFLSVMSVLRGKLQLVGTACMLVASKFEEIYPPEVTEFVYITDDTYSAKQVLKMESLILKTINFDVSVPTIVNFLERFVKAADCPESDHPKFEALSKYLCELTLLDADPYLKYLPSTIAASSIVLALHTLGFQSWSPTLSHYTGFQLLDLQACLHNLHRTFSHASKHPQQAIREKYRSPRFHGVANLSAPEMLPLA
ncbi:G2/mitotic-specific cyclin-A-like isoform X1 [Montipora foliosa]|uniref:G2/mitotic-specific cyclin-A-like isoform X1 n=1 Tax=Montipora foliosa TaxID=591990 RepID=UPI0035F1800C